LIDPQLEEAADLATKLSSKRHPPRGAQAEGPYVDWMRS
jgi:hypothetical protein